MNKQKIKTAMVSLIVLGVILIIGGIYLIAFTHIATQGVSGILITSGLIAAGLFILIPAKLYLSLIVMKQNDERLRGKNGN